MKRRLFLKGSVASAALAVFATALSPRKAFAAWQATAFEAKSVQEALKNAYGTDLTDTSDAIQIKAQEIAENGAMVPVEVVTRLPNPETISLVIENNPTPLAATFFLGPETNGMVATRVKMSKTSNVIAVVRSGGKLYSARKEVKVTIGGCGG